MTTPLASPAEQQRLTALRSYEVLDTGPEQEFDDIASLAARICETPIAFISLIDENRLWLKARVGTTDSEISRDYAICVQGSQADVFEVEDTQMDQRFAASILVTGGAAVRYYAGAPLVMPDGHVLGMLCVLDHGPRQLSARKKTALQALSRQVVSQLALRRSVLELRHTAGQLQRTEKLLHDRTRLALMEADVCSALARGETLAESLRLCGEAIVQHLDAATAQLWIVNENEQMLELLASTGVDADFGGPQSRVPVGKFMAGSIAEQRTPHLTNELEGDSWAKRDGIVAFAGYPLLVGDRLMGVVAMFARRSLTNEILTVLASIAVPIALAIESKRWETALRESEERFRGTFERAAVGMAHVSTEGRFLRVNDKLCAIVGYERHELLAMTFGDLTVPEDQAGGQDARRAMLAGERSTYATEKRYRRKNGESVWISLVTTLERTAEGDAKHFISVFEEITLRKQTEESLHRSQAMMRMAGRIGRIGAWSVELPEYQLTWSDEVCGIHEMPPGFAPTPEKALDFIALEFRERLTLSFEACLRDGAPFDVEAQILTAHGRRVWVRVAGEAERDHAGAVRRIQGAFQDISERMRAEEAQRKEQELFAAVFENVTDGIVACDADGVLTLFNRATRQYHGLPAERISADRWAEHYDLYLPDGKTRMTRDQTPLMRALTEGSIQDVEVVIAPKGGPAHRVLASGQSFYDSNGVKIGAVVALYEITKHRRNEETLQRQRTELRVLFDLIPAMICFKNTDNVLLRVNQRLAETTGKSVDEIEGRSALEVFPKEAAGHYADDLEVIRSGKPKMGIIEKLPGSQGRDRWVQTDKVPYFDKAGNVIGVVLMAQDITERKRAESELFRSRETLRGILDHIPQRVFWKDRKLIYQGCNKAFALDMGFSDPSEVIGKTDFEASWRMVAEGYRADDQEVMDLDVAKASFEEPGIATDGRAKWLRTSKIPLHDRQGLVTGVLGTYEDVTEHKLAKLEIERLNADLEERVAQRTEDLFVVTQEAELANHAKSKFLSRTSHELRTPMNAILGFGQLLETEENLEPEARESVAQILDAGRHLLTLIDEVLDISTADSGTMILALESVAVDQVIEEALQGVRPLGATFRVDLEAHLAPDRNWRVVANAKRLKQVLQNLLSNAIQYNHPGGKVTLVCAPGRADDGLSLRFSVSDTGPGITAENLTRLFTPFDRLDAERTRTHVIGTGLGLTVSKHLVELMGGRIGVESAVGKGSTFWVEIPRAECLVAPSDQAMAPDLPIPLSDSSGSGTLLYIEDNVSYLRVMARILDRRPAIQLRVAATGSSGVRMAREYLPDLIVLDLRLSDMNGDQVVRELRADPRTSGIPVVVFTADRRQATRERMMVAGARTFLTKPVDVRTLLDVIDQFIEYLPEGSADP